tara:strand:+ start:4704 stop:4946 length:243 start_codon:yes stop_codon:yes gene_type:complete
MKIEPLSKEKLDEAIDLLLEIFGSSSADIDDPRKWLPASLNPEDYKELYDSFGVGLVNYWVAIEKRKSNRYNRGLHFESG